MLSLSAIGNNGQLFCISRTEKSDSNAYYSFLSSKFAEERFMGGRFSYLDIKAFNMMEFPDGIRKPLMEEVVSFCNECISGGEQYGFKYINS